jgi:thioredoxin reductase
MVVGGGDSAIEAALALADEGNDVTISYRRDKFQRLKPKNLEKINNAQYDGTVKVIFNSNVKEIKDDSIILTLGKDEKAEIGNDYIFIFAGGELPNAFLKKIGITISKKFGEAVLKPGD